MDKRSLKRILINLSLILINIAVFSGAFIGVNIFSGNPVELIAGLTVFLLTVIVFVITNYAGFLGKFGIKYNKKESDREIITLKQCEAALYAFLNKKESGQFEDSLNKVIAQVAKFESKRALVSEALSKSFEKTEITYIKFNTTINEIEAVIIGNIKNLINRLNMFGDFAGHINKTISNCDDINSKMDKLLYELSLYNAQNDEKIDQESALRELQGLIDSVKWYK